MKPFTVRTNLCYIASWFVWVGISTANTLYTPGSRGDFSPGAIKPVFLGGRTFRPPQVYDSLTKTTKLRIRIFDEYNPFIKTMPSFRLSALTGLVTQGFRPVSPRPCCQSVESTGLSITARFVPTRGLSAAVISRA